jgi:hypothetical protein
VEQEAETRRAPRSLPTFRSGWLCCRWRRSSPAIAVRAKAVARSGASRPNLDAAFDMLTSLLPGLRDLRAPLAAGYLRLFAIWIAFEPSLGTGESGVAASLLNLKEELTPVGLAAAVSFIAYLIGSLSVVLPARHLAVMWRRSEQLSPRRNRGGSQMRADRAMALSPKGASALWELVDRRVRSCHTSGATCCCPAATRSGT